MLQDLVSVWADLKENMFLMFVPHATNRQGSDYENE